MSANNSLNDTIQPYTFKKEFIGDGFINFSGTSYSSPLAIIEVAKMRQEGIEIKDINNILRTRLTESYLSTPNNIILKDGVKALDRLEYILSIVEDKNKDKYLNPSFIKQIGIFSKTELHYIIEVLESKIPLENIKQIQESLNKDSKLYILPIDTFRSILNTYQKLDPNQKNEFIKGLSLKDNKNKLESLENYIEQVKTKNEE